jgi:hypothetical protein
MFLFIYFFIFYFLLAEEELQSMKTNYKILENELNEIRNQRRRQQQQQHLFSEPKPNRLISSEHKDEEEEEVLGSAAKLQASIMVFLFSFSFF